jgi:hypothetical protein
MLHYLSLITHPCQHYKTPQYHAHFGGLERDITEFVVRVPPSFLHAMNRVCVKMVRTLATNLAQCRVNL